MNWFVYISVVLCFSTYEASSQYAVSQFDCGNESTVCIIGGDLYGTGSNSNNMLLAGDADAIALVKKLDSKMKWRMVACGSQHSLAIRSDGTLWSWGSNSYGQLGMDAEEATSTPKMISSRTDWVSVSCGFAVSYAITSSGELFGCGMNAFHQIANGGEKKISELTQIGPKIYWNFVTVNGFHTLAISADSSLYGWGLNSVKQICDELADVIIEPKIITRGPVVSASAGFIHSLCVYANGSMWGWGSNISSQLGDEVENIDAASMHQLGKGINWAKCEAGPMFSFGITVDGGLFGWGLNRDGQTGTGVKAELVKTPTEVEHDCRWVTVSASVGQIYNNLVFGSHALAMDERGRMYGAGVNYLGQLSQFVDCSTDFKLIKYFEDGAPARKCAEATNKSNMVFHEGDNQLVFSGIGNCDSMHVSMYDIHGVTYANGTCDCNGRMCINRDFEDSC
ncbi:MAG: hypothetical protein WC824_08315, partial [Bacteroidota bacterium]